MRSPNFRGMIGISIWTGFTVCYRWEYLNNVRGRETRMFGKYMKKNGHARTWTFTEVRINKSTNEETPGIQKRILPSVRTWLSLFVSLNFDGITNYVTFYSEKTEMGSLIYVAPATSSSPFSFFSDLDSNRNDKRWFVLQAFGIKLKTLSWKMIQMDEVLQLKWLTIAGYFLKRNSGKGKWHPSGSGFRVASLKVLNCRNILDSLVEH